MILTIIAILIIAFFLIGYFGNKKREQRRIADPVKFAEEEAAELAFKSATKFTCEYFMGHPDIDKPLKVYLYNDGKGNLSIANGNSFLEKKLGTVATSVIDNVTVEDQSTIEKKVSLGRVLLVGVFALAWKKNKKAEAAYVIIEWKQGKFTHETYFRIDGNNAIGTANTIRNQIIKWVEVK
jgi:hypothetical protein